jgi:uncharacterized membrane protein (DUF485 family)
MRAHSLSHTIRYHTSLAFHRRHIAGVAASFPQWRICSQKSENGSNLSRSVEPRGKRIRNRGGINARHQEKLMANAARERDLEIVPSKQYEASQSTWDKIAESREFQDLLATKKIFIVPAFIFFVVYYFALPVLVGYAPQFMSTKVIGEVNLAYLFALSQFFVAWLIAGLYVKAANNFDRLAKDILNKAEDAREASKP